MQQARHLEWMGDEGEPVEIAGLALMAAFGERERLPYERGALEEVTAS